MKFKVHSLLKYNINENATFLLNIQACHSSHQQIVEESLIINPELPFEEFESKTGARYIRLHTDEPCELSIDYKAIVITNPREIAEEQLNKVVGLNHIDDAVISYIFPSRYCQSDKLYRFASNEFGHYANNYEKVKAIENWIHDKVLYLSGSTDASTSAFDTVTELAGVCRDFAHLGIALCRALSIPARYFAGYAHKLNPQDFHACFEAFIGNEWVFFDATKLVPINTLVKIAHGHDAADTSVANIFGSADLVLSQVTCTALDNDIVFLYNNDKAISYS